MVFFEHSWVLSSFELDAALCPSSLSKRMHTNTKRSKQTAHCTVKILSVVSCASFRLSGSRGVAAGRSAQLILHDYFPGVQDHLLFMKLVSTVRASAQQEAEIGILSCMSFAGVQDHPGWRASASTGARCQDPCRCRRSRAAAGRSGRHPTVGALDLPECQDISARAECNVWLTRHGDHLRPCCRPVPAA